MAAVTTSQTPKSQEFSVQVSREGRKKFHLMKFASGADVDFVKLGNTSLKLERENNLRDYKSAYDIDVAPRFGAGSVFGREQKEEARRRKYGVLRQKYDSEKQPWMLKVGTGKQAKKYKGVREGTVSENTSYYIFTQKPDGAFEAFPLNEWYTFSQIIKYKYLNSEEAEDEFNKRDKTMNFFNIMLKKRLTQEVDSKNMDKEENEKSQMSKGKKDKDFLLTEMDEWAIMSDDDCDADMDDDDKDNSDSGKKPKKKQKVNKGEVKKRPKNAKQNSDDEAIEESDEGDFDDREVDYMTGSESSLSDVEEKGNVDEDKGVDEEHGLRKLIDSGDESEEEEKEEENEDKEDTEDKAKKGSGSGSSSSESSDSDLEKDVNSAIFIQKKNLAKKEKQRSRSSTPQNTMDVTGDKKVLNPKRKQEGSDASSSKKPRTSSPLLAAGPPGEGITEEAIRRYLVRKPMTTKDLLQKFKSKKINMPSEQMATEITQLLKRLNPDQTYVNKTLYLSLKAPDK